MGATDFGTQDISLKYHEAAEARKFNRLFRSIRERGLYAGGYLAIVDDTHVTLDVLLCEIGDNTYQVKISTAVSVSVVVGVAIPYVVLRWVYTGAVSNYMDVLAVSVGNIQDNDLIVGKCNFIGATLSGITYLERTNPKVIDLFLLVEPTAPASMKVRVRAGRANFGSVNYDILDQLTVTLVAPGSNSRIDVIYVNVDGTIQILAGTAAASPSPPDYADNVVLAEITLASATTEITEDEIKDVRNFLS
ncbi:MAG TPA: hypothetical protein ENI23_08155 [bacterium]|nr:hypothetical protein [bacterium]